MPKIHMVAAINEALRLEMERDPNVIILGEDVGIDGGVFRVSEGVFEKFGKDRVIDAPLAEAGIVGTAIGLAINGCKPVVEIQFVGFSYEAFHHINHHLSRYRSRTQGGISVPIVLRAPTGGGIKALELHSESPETFFVHSTGIKVVVPSNPYDAKGLMISAIRDPDPVIFLEPEKLYRSFKEEVPSEIDCEVIDLRTIWPLDTDKIIESVKKTGRAVVVHEAPRTAGFGAEIAALLSEKAIDSLQAPIKRVTGYDVIVPLPQLEDYYIPSDKKILQAIDEVMHF